MAQQSSVNVQSSDSQQPLWVPTAEPGLYKHRDNGRFYSRFSINGKRPYVALKTAVWSQALAKHKRRVAQATEAKNRGVATGQEDNLRTLGDCCDKLLAQLKLTGQSEETKSNYRCQIETLKANWPKGSFKTFSPSEVDFPLLLQLREKLLTAEWTAPAGFKSQGGERKGKGYSARYVNQMLARVQNVMAVARHYGLCSHDPFESGVGIHGSIWLPLPKAKKDLPTLEQMQEVFRVMGGIKPGKTGINGATAEEPNYLKWRLDRALDASEHSRFLAYTGCRLEEANQATFEDLLPKDENGQAWLRIRGTKTESSDRTIPAFEDLSRLMEEIRARRIKDGLPTAGKLLRVATSRNALATACAKVGVIKLGHHTLRHYFATLALSRGVPVQIAADWMGHKDKGATLLRVYAHVIREQSASYAGRLTYEPRPSARLNGA